MPWNSQKQKISPRERTCAVISGIGSPEWCYSVPSALLWEETPRYSVPWRLPCCARGYFSWLPRRAETLSPLALLKIIRYLGNFLITNSVLKHFDVRKMEMCYLGGKNEFGVPEAVHFVLPAPFSPSWLHFCWKDYLKFVGLL